MNWNTPEMFSFINAEEKKEVEVEKVYNYAAK